MEPMQAVNHETYKLEGFRWEIKRKPLTVEDLFRAWDGEAPYEMLVMEVVTAALKLLEGERK